MSARLARTEGGASIVEALLVGLLLLVPLAWGLSFLSELHRAALASTAAVREAGFDSGRAVARTDGARAAERAVAVAFRDHGLDPGDAELRWASTFRRGSAIEVLVRYPVKVTRIPFLGEVAGPAIWVEARHVARVEPYRSRT